MEDMNRKNLLVLTTAVLVGLIPFLFWRATWFGRRLNEVEIDGYLSGDKPRLAQHALIQVSERIVSGGVNPGDAARWYPRITRLAQHQLPEIRRTAAWVMGQDNTSAEFHQALLNLLQDPDPLVRRNAALSLVRFGDLNSRRELLSMLRPYQIQSPRAGRISLRLEEQEAVNPGTLLARLEIDREEVIEIRSPLPGFLHRRLVAEGQNVAAGTQILVLSPASDQVWEALRALFLVGGSEELPEVERIASASGEEGLNERIRRQAELTARAIRSRL